MTRSSDSRWGLTVRREVLGDHPILSFFPRPTSCLELLEGAEQRGQMTFLVQGTRRVSYGEFAIGIKRAAQLLNTLGARRGDRVMILAFNSPEWLASLFAVWQIGAVPVVGNRWWSAEERIHALDVVTPTLVLTDDADSLSGEPNVVDMGEVRRSLSDTTGGDESESAQTDEDDVALVLFTSGTTGTPKGVMLSHRAIIGNQHNLLYRTRRLPLRRDLQGEHPMVSLIASPLFHIGGLGGALTGLILGAKLVFLLGRFDSREALTLIETERVTTWGGVPAMAQRLLDDPAFGSYDLSSLRSFAFGGSPLGGALVQEVRERVPHIPTGIANAWGMSESAGFLTLASGRDLVDRPGTVGRPCPTVEVRVLERDDSGTGELAVRSPTLMLGYFGMDDRAVDSDGWLRTGDLGRIDDAGFVYISGRSKEIVIRGGENISCARVEDVLTRHPAVHAAVVFGVPDADLGELVAAVVAVRSGQAPTSPAALRQFCSERLAYFEIPARWVITFEDLPILGSGKIDRRAVVARHRGSIID